ncbi:MAG: hypothetical protein J7K94_07235 [Dehalococcoidia bacterium]|nr:hypothetical protein [Dehalococcoidia bacterium]
MKKWPALIVLALLVLPAAGCVSPSLALSLEAEETVLPPGGQTIIQCHTSGGIAGLSYLWLSDGGEIEGQGISVRWIAPDEEGDYVITVKAIEPATATYTTTTQETTTYTASIPISVRENKPPVISDLIASEERFVVNGSYTIVSMASDAEGSDLTYEWETTGGTIGGEGSTITWTAPGVMGTYEVAVTVRDDMDGESSRSISLNVEINHPPVITSVVITADHKYLMKLEPGSPDDYKTGKGEIYQVECQAEDEDGDVLTYDWEASRGNIQGMGPAATWIAPNDSCDVIITVTVSDGRGGTAAQEVKVKIVNCSPCVFGH